MPLFRQTQVSPLPLPNLLQLPTETEVWLIHQTAEVFTSYDSYANRFLFYSQPIFTPDIPQIHSSQSPCMSFFQALNLELHHLDQLIQTNFPTSLKPRLISSLLLPSTQLQPNINHLVDHLYDIYHNRFDVDERVVVDLALNSSPSSSSSLHDARIIRVFPPKKIRDLEKNSSYSNLIHLGAIHRFQLNLSQYLIIDDAEAYIYTIQLIDNQQSKSDHFDASYMEVDATKLGRHPDSFSRSLLKRFLQSVLLPHSPTSPSARWTIHPDVALHPNSSILAPLPAVPVPNHTRLIKPRNLNQTVASKRATSQQPLKKRKKNSLQCPPLEDSLTRSPASPQDHPSHLSSNLTVTDPKIPPLSKQKRQLKNQIKSLPLEPQSNHPLYPIDDPPRKKKKQIVNSTHSVTPTPVNSQSDLNIPLNSETPKPTDPSGTPQSATAPTTATRESKKSIKYPIEDLDLDPLTVIDGRHLRKANPTPLSLPKKPQPARQKLNHKFAQKLKIWSFVNIFRLNERRCRFEEFDKSLDDLTACLVKLILRQSRLRYPNTRPTKFTSVSVLPFFATHPAQECTVMSIDEREYWVRKGLRFLNFYRKSHELSQTANSTKKKLNRSIVEEDWVMGLVEIMCHRGGIERLGCTARIFKYFFSNDATLLTIDHACDQDDRLDDSAQPPKNSHPCLHAGQTNLQARTLRIDGDSPLTSEIDGNSDDQKRDLSIEEADVIEDDGSEDGIETGDEDGRRYGKSIRDQRDHPKQLKKTLVSRFEGLPAEDKLTLIDFLCELAMESDKVRNYMEECDEKLTVVRKEKADVNKEKRKVLEELTRLENRKAASTPKVPPSLSSAELTSTQDCEPSPILDQCKSKSAELPFINTPAPLVEFSEPCGLGSQHSNEPDEDTKPKLSPTMSSSNPANPVDLLSKQQSPQIKANIKKLETPKQPNNRPLETHVRVATLNARQIKQPSHLGTDEFEIEKHQLEKQLFDIGLKELQLQERFRQLIGVTKLKPLGVDRFYCKYWWFDGIGGMEIHSEDEEKNKIESYKSDNNNDRGEENGIIETEDVKWYSGCLFVSGPCIEEWDKICESYGGHDQVLNRRLREESGNFDHNNQLSLDTHLSSKTRLMGVDEWGIYDTESQIEELMNWLNSKGTRENNLKMNLKDWKEYITYGIQGRNKASLSSSSSSKDHQIQNHNVSTTTIHQGCHDLTEKNGFKKIDKRKSLKLENNNNSYNLDDCSSKSDSIRGTDSNDIDSDSIATDDSYVDHLDQEVED